MRYWDDEDVVVSHLFARKKSKSLLSPHRYEHPHRHSVTTSSVALYVAVAAADVVVDAYVDVDADVVVSRFYSAL